MSPQPPPERPAVAIIGMAASLPGATDLDEFWANIRAGRESITHGTPLVVSDEATGRRWVHARGVLADPQRFDAAFFGIPRREAELLDPQHRCLLEHAWAAMEEAGYDPGRLTGDVAVYTSAGPNTYREGREFGTRSAADRLLVQLSNSPDTLPTRVSYKLGLTGESVNVQTACSSALVAVHLACEALRDGRADMAVAGAANIRCYETLAYEHQEGFILSADGHTRAYDRAASGYVEGDGVGVVVLRRLADAVEQGDHIHAVIKASAANNDGRAKVGFSAPSIEGQTRVIASALAASGVPAESIGLLEGHGTATPVGDPIEVRALTRAYRALTARSGYCALGSVKSNIGHLGYASGIAGLLKAVLCVKHGELPPTPLFEEPNPEIDFADSPFYVNRELRVWHGSPRRAGVSSFGMGGTNVHVIIEQPQQISQAPAAGAAGEHAVLLSARSDEALRASKQRLHAFVAANPDTDLADLAFTLATGRRAHAHRWTAVVSSTAGLARVLAADTPPGGTDPSGLAELARQWGSGATVDWGARYAGQRRRRLPLPTYPWQGERLWVQSTAPEGTPGHGVPHDPEEQAPITRWLYRPTWTRTSLPRPYHPGDLPQGQGACLIFGDSRGLTRRLRSLLTATGLAPVIVAPGTRYEPRPGGRVRVRPGEPTHLTRLVESTVAQVGPIRQVLHLWSGGRRSVGQAQDMRMGVLTMLCVVQALATARQAPDLWVVTTNAQPAHGDTPGLDLDAAALLGLSRVIPQEHPEMRCRCVDFSMGMAPAEMASRLLAEMASGQETPETVYRGGDRLVTTLEQVEIAAGTEVPLRPRGVYLVTGGSGRIGLTIAEHIARAAPGARIALVSRRGAPAVADGADQHSPHRLGESGAEVMSFAADVADEPQMVRVVDAINKRWGPVNGVWHAAGIEESRSFAFIAQTSVERAEEVLRPKVPGIAVLDRVTRSQPLDFCLVCASLNSVLGGIAYGVYAAANRYLDSYAHWRRAQGAPWVSVDWDTWQFEESGAARIGAAASRTAIRPEQGAGLFGPIIAAAQPQVVVSTTPLPERIERIRTSMNRRREADDGAAGQTADVSCDEVGQTVRRIVGELVGVAGLTDDDELLAVGCDSLTLLEAVARIERRLRAKVPIARLWGRRTVGELAEVGWQAVNEERAAARDVGGRALRYLAG
jgi:acyl transferase domain-containing protein